MQKLKIDPRLYVLLAVLIFLLPLKWLSAWCAAVCLHELFHFAAVKLYRGKIRIFSLNLGGADMECTDLSDKAYMLSVLAGPLGGLLLVLLGRWLPRLAICSWLLSVYNLLPVLPLDGGQALRIMLKDKNALGVLQRIMLFVVSILAAYLCFIVKLGPLPVVIAISLWIKNQKYLAKNSFEEYNRGKTIKR